MCGITPENASQFYHEKALHKAKLRKNLQNNCPVLFKGLEVMKDKEVEELYRLKMRK